MTVQPDDNKNMIIRFEERKGYLYAFMTGRRGNVLAAIKFWQRVVDECNLRGYKRLLVEQDFPDPLSAIDAFHVAEAVSKMKVSQLKMVLVDRDQTQNDINMFVETVAVNRGILGRVFANVSDAEAWLLS